MKTLTTNITNNYLLTGSRPRLFLNIENVGKSWATTGALTGYTDRIANGITISEKVDSAGGMGVVSSANVDILKLGESIKFYSEATIYPRPAGVQVGAGHIQCRNLVYADARKATIGTSYSYTNILVGQLYDPDSLYYYIFRPYFQFNIPAGVTSCEDAYIDLTLLYDISDTDFTYYLVTGTFTTDSIYLASFNDFLGWSAVGTTDYTGTQLNETINTATSVKANTRIRFNRNGRNLITSMTGSVLKLMLLSSRDYDYDTSHIPTGAEYNQFSVVNQSTPVLKMIYNTITPDNQRARIYLGYEDKSTGLPSAITDVMNIWSGVVDKWSFNEKFLKLFLRHDDFKYNRKLTSDVIKLEDFLNCPSDNIGKPLPIVIGDFSSLTHEKNLGSFLNETDTDNRYGNGDFVKGYLTGLSSAVFASHAFKLAGFYWAIWESSVNSFVLLCGNLTEDGDAQYSIAPGDAADFPYRMVLDDTVTTAVQPMLVYAIPHLEDSNIDPTASDVNGVNAADSDYTNWALLDGTYVGLGSGATYEDWSSSWGVSNMQEEDIAIIVETLAENGYVSDGVRLTFYVYKDDGSVLASEIHYLNTDGQHIFYFSNVDLDKIRIDILVTITAVKNISAKPVKFRNLCVCKAYSSKLPKEVYMKCMGLADDISGTYTGTASELIENPSDIIRWFSVVKGELPSANIGDSFTTARTTLSSWKFAFQWSDKLNIDNVFPWGGKKAVVTELAKQCKSTVIWDNLGSLKINVFSVNNGFANSGTDFPNDLDIFEFSGTPSSSSLTKNSIFSYSLDKIDLNKVYNDFILKYSLNYATDNYDKILYMTNGSGTKASVEHNMTEAYFENSQTVDILKTYTSESYNLVNTTNTFEFEAWAIRDESTANKLLQYFIEWHTKRRWEVTLTTGINASHFELGDFINIRFDDIEYQIGTASMNVKKWKITEIENDFQDMKIRIKAIEVETL